MKICFAIFYHEQMTCAREKSLTFPFSANRDLNSKFQKHILLLPFLRNKFQKNHKKRKTSLKYFCKCVIMLDMKGITVSKRFALVNGYNNKLATTYLWLGAVAFLLLIF
jgi:hypothetical protein